MSLNFTTKLVPTNPPHSGIFPKQHKAGWDLIPGNKDVSTLPPFHATVIEVLIKYCMCV